MRRGLYQPLSTHDEGLPRGARLDRLPSRENARGQPPPRPKPFKMSDYKLEDTDFSTMNGKMPYGAVALAILLTLIGMASFVIAWLHVTQEILGKKQAEYGFTILGLMTFIPGFYHARIAYYTWRGYKGYSYDMIPSS